VKLFEALANTQERREIRNSVRALCDRFDDRYWAEKDRLHEFPHEFADAAASKPATAQSARAAGWATPPNITSKDISAKWSQPSWPRSHAR
jgi:hypothetical protein